jgi:TusA-related sulfurtransferase
MTDSNNHAIENSSHTLDLRGLRCPIVAIRALKFLKSNSLTTQLNILVTDSSTLQDIPRAILGLGWTAPVIEELVDSVQPTWRLHFAASH